MKVQKRVRSLISILLTLSMLLTLLPVSVFAADPEVAPPTSAEFKVMGLYSLRDNGRRVSYFSYETRENTFLTNANATYPDSWFKLVHTIEKSQPITLELYEMKDEPEYMDVDKLPMPYLATDTADGFGALQHEEFLGERLGVLVGVPVLENIAPLNDGDDILTAPKVRYSPIDDDTWWHILYETINGERKPQVLENFYSFGYEGNRLEILDAEPTEDDLTLDQATEPTENTTEAGSEVPDSNESTTDTEASKENNEAENPAESENSNADVTDENTSDSNSDPSELDSDAITSEEPNNEPNVDEEIVSDIQASADQGSTPINDAVEDDEASPAADPDVNGETTSAPAVNQPLPDDEVSAETEASESEANKATDGATVGSDEAETDTPAQPAQEEENESASTNTQDPDATPSPEEELPLMKRSR